MASAVDTEEARWVKKYEQDRPAGLEDWLDEHPTIPRDTVIKILVLHVDRVMSKVMGIQDTNQLWDGS